MSFLIDPNGISVRATQKNQQSPEKRKSRRKAKCKKKESETLSEESEEELEEAWKKENRAANHQSILEPKNEKKCRTKTTKK